MDSVTANIKTQDGTVILGSVPALLDVCEPTAERLGSWEGEIQIEPDRIGLIDISQPYLIEFHNGRSGQIWFRSLDIHQPEPRHYVSFTASFRGVGALHTNSPVQPEATLSWRDRPSLI